MASNPQLSNAELRDNSNTDSYALSAGKSQSSPEIHNKNNKSESSTPQDDVNDPFPALPKRSPARRVISGVGAIIIAVLCCPCSFGCRSSDEVFQMSRRNRLW
jgi:hypothetical protein